MAVPFVSAIVPVYNDPDGLRACLEALARQNYPRDRYEVIVVDNASSQPVALIVQEFPNASAAYEPQQGSYAARNRGIALAKGDILAFTDADCIPHAGWLEAGVAALENEQADLIAGGVNVFPRDASRPTAVELFEMLYSFPQEDNVRAGYCVTANLMARRRVVEAIGAFDASLKTGGDRVWTSRAVTAGYKLVYAPAAVVEHRATSSFRALFRRYSRFTGGHYERCRGNPLAMRRARRKTLMFLLKPPLRLAYDSLRTSPPQRLVERAQIAMVRSFLRWAYVYEWLRLETGGRARR